MHIWGVGLTTHTQGKIFSNCLVLLGSVPLHLMLPAAHPPCCRDQTQGCTHAENRSRAISQQQFANISPATSNESSLVVLLFHFVDSSLRFWQFLRFLPGAEAAPDDPSGHPPSLAGASARYPRSLQVTGSFLPLP